jgi:hypothetical protein
VETQTNRPSRRKLWIGFGLMCIAGLVWALAIKLAVGSVEEFPILQPGATPEEVHAALERHRPPSASGLVGSMMMGYALSGVFFMGGAIVTAMGLIDYAAEVWKRA